MNATTTKVGTPIDHVNLTKVAKTPTVKKAKKIGVVGISKAENVQLGLILRWVALELDWDTIPNNVLVNPEALTKLIGRYQLKAQ